MKPSTPLPTTPMCDRARQLPTLVERLRHYRQCHDPRCQARAAAGAMIAAGLAKAMKGGGK